MGQQAVTGATPLPRIRKRECFRYLGSYWTAVRPSKIVQTTSEELPAAILVEAERVGPMEQRYAGRRSPGFKPEPELLVIPLDQVEKIKIQGPYQVSA